MTAQTIADRLGSYATPTLFEAGPGVRACAPAIAPLFRPIQLAGPAFPVQASAGDNLAVHRALAAAPAGAVLVVAMGGETRYGFWGEILLAAALARGLRGLVTDGAVRDSRALRAAGFPIFCGGLAIPGTVKQWPGVIGEAVVLGGALVQPGDFMVGDDDGVVVVAAEHVAAVLERAEARVAREAGIIARLREGATTLELFGLDTPRP